MEIIVTLLFGCGISGLIGMAIGSLGAKNNSFLGFVFGALLGPIGWIITAIIPANASADPASPSSPVVDQNAAKIAQLEAQLAQLKSAPKPAVKKSPHADIGDDGGIPTYKLD